MICLLAEHIARRTLRQKGCQKVVKHLFLVWTLIIYLEVVRWFIMLLVYANVEPVLFLWYLSISLRNPLTIQNNSGANSNSSKSLCFFFVVNSSLYPRYSTDNTRNFFPIDWQVSIGLFILKRGLHGSSIVRIFAQQLPKC